MQSKFNVRWNPEGFMKKAGAVAISGAIVFGAFPTLAIADDGMGGGAGGGASQEAPGEPPSGGMGPGSGEGGMGGGMGGANTMTFDYTGSFSGALTADGEAVEASDESIAATEVDQNAALAQNGGTLNLSGMAFTKSGDDTNGDNCNFYGLNSILLSVGEGSLATVANSSLVATSEGSNGIFATDNATVYAWDTSIQTSAGNSRGLDATYGGTVIADSMDISTEGDHCASVATDRGGGSISVTNSTFATAGSGSPLLYSTGDIEVSEVEGTTTGSQLAGMEGLNTILINNSTLTSTITGTTGSDPVANGVIIYQSTSGDAEATTGDTATFQAADSKLTSAIASGSMFYLTNTSADIVLSNTTLDFDSDAASLLLAAGNDSNNWGSAGNNGATVKFTCIDEDVAGDIVADTISSVDAYLTDGTTWTGASSIQQNSAGSTSSDPVSISVDGTSTWVVTEDSTVSNLTVADGGAVVDEAGNTVTIVADGATVVEGTSSVTVTVEGAYSAAYDASAAGELTSDVIDRSDFDAESGKSTEWAMGDAVDSAAQTEATTTVSTSNDAAEATEAEPVQEANPVVAFFQGIAAWFAGLFN